MLMYKRLFIIYIIGCFLIPVMLVVSTFGIRRGDYFLFGSAVGFCTLAPFNALFFYLLHKIRIVDILKMSIQEIFFICSIALIVPSVINALGCNFFHNYVFLYNTKQNEIILHERVWWFDPIALHLYAYIIIFGYYTMRELGNRGNRGRFF